jgi:DNA-binding CsgD family transcriptional regulator
VARADRGRAVERAAVDAGRQILDIIDRSAELGRSRDTPADLYLPALTRAEEARLNGDDDPAAWASAASQAAKNGWPHDEGWARYRQAESVLTAGNDRGVAVAALRRAAALARNLDAVPLARRTNDLASRARIDLMPESVPSAAVEPDPAPPFGLTKREREVLALVSAGRTNREIGEALFISEKTASVHVTHILDKMGVSSRVEAALLASRTEPFG